MKRAPDQAGFTLVELLVVITIIAILASLSLPFYRLGIAHANKAKCESNLRQIGVAMFGFAAENDENLPESGGVIPYGTTDPTTKTCGWCQQLEPYVGPGTGVGGKDTIFQCPDSSKVIPENQTYSYFNGAHAALADTGGFAPVSLIKVKSPSQHIMAGDIAVAGLFTSDDADKDDYTQDPAFGGNAGTIPIHLGASNVLFYDGHVASLKKFDPVTMTTVYTDNNTDYLHTAP